MERAVVVSFGRNVGSEPMSDHAWHLFQRAVLAEIRWYRGTVYTVADGRGEWNGIAEESRMVAAALESSRLAEFTRGLARIARDFEQDAIALTTGETTLVGARA